MQRRIFATANFKLALLYAVLFSLSVIVLELVMFYSIRVSLEQQASAHIESEMAQLLGDYRDDGLDELSHDIRERVKASNGNRLLFAIQHSRQPTLFDPLPTVTTAGWHRDTRHHLLIAVATLDDGYRLLIAADMSRIEELENAMRNRFVLALVVTLLFGAAGGVLISKRFLRRVDRLSKTAERIGDGFLSERIPISPAGDEFDQLTATINRMLERIETLVGDVHQVSTSIAHDLRTPLSRLRQKLEALQAKSEAPEIDESIALLDETLETFSALLRIAEIESGLRKSGFARVDLSELLERIADLYRPAIEDAGMQLEASIAAGITIEGDEALLTQLFANLIENALRHAVDGKWIAITLDREATVTISDRGPGIPADTHRDIFKRFYRLERSRTTKGSGLGLCLASAIATLHGTRIELADAAPGLRVTLRFQPTP